MKELFKELGLDKKETDTFLTLLELGAQPVSVVAKHVGVPRSTMYLILDKLKKIGLIEEFKRAGVTYAKCIPVRNIPDIIKAEERRLEGMLAMFEEQSKDLEALENKLSITPHVKFFEGKNEVMKMYEMILREKGFLAISNSHYVKKIMPEYHYKIPENIRDKKLNTRELLADCSEGHEYKKLFNSKKHQIRILPEEMKFASDIIICSDRIYMISYGERDISATEIINKSLAETQIMMFEELWKGIKT